MKRVQWNISKKTQPVYGAKRYEEESIRKLYKGSGR